MEDANWDTMLWRRRGVSALLLCWMVAERESNFVLCVFCLLAALTVTVDVFNINIYKMMANSGMYVWARTARSYQWMYYFPCAVLKRRNLQVWLVNTKIDWSQSWCKILQTWLMLLKPKATGWQKFSTHLAIKFGDIKCLRIWILCTSKIKQHKMASFSVPAHASRVFSFPTFAQLVSGWFCIHFSINSIGVPSPHDNLEDVKIFNFVNSQILKLGISLMLTWQNRVALSTKKNKKPMQFGKRRTKSAKHVGLYWFECFTESRRLTSVCDVVNPASVNLRRKHKQGTWSLLSSAKQHKHLSERRRRRRRRIVPLNHLQ